jgi:hypothetical protein
MVNNINTHINMHKIMNTHINNINTHNLYLRWRAARRRRDERGGAVGTAAGRGRADGAVGTTEGPSAASSRRGEQAGEHLSGGAACSGRTAVARGRRGEGAAASRRRDSGQRKARRRAAGAAAGREEEESVREEKGERRTVGNFIF